MRLWGKEKRLERRRRSICCIPKSRLLQHRHVCRSVPRTACKAASELWTYRCQALSKSGRYHGGCTVLFSRSLRGRNFLRPAGGALESEEMAPFSMKLLLITSCDILHVETDYVISPISIYICVMQINNQVVYSC